MTALAKRLAAYALPGIWAIALAGTAGSLYAGALGYEPCSLCWWQRVFLYPLVLIVPLEWVTGNVRASVIALTLAIPGGLVALYHELLYAGVLHEALQCAPGVSCTEHVPSVLGVNLILASLLAFAAIVLLSWVDLAKSR